MTFDLSVIALFQLAALLYGMSIVFQTRPVYVVFSKNSFDLVTANTLLDADIAKAKYPDYRSLPLAGPVYVYSEMPTDIKENNEVVLSAFSGKDLAEFPQFYKPYAEHGVTVGQAAKPISTLKELNPERIAEIDDALIHSDRNVSDIGFLPLRAKYQDQAVLVEKSDGRVLKILPIRPWPPLTMFNRDKE